MKRYLVLVAVILAAAAVSFGQGKSNEAIQKQIKSLKADKTIALTYDAGSDTSKIMVIAGNFDEAEGIEAMNFGMAFFYKGKTLTSAPEEINFTFWVLNKKPKFAEAHAWKVTLGTETLDLGDARYVAKPNENMEYLNFKISRKNLEKIAAAKEVKFKLGNFDFKFTTEQLKTFANLLALIEN